MSDKYKWAGLDEFMHFFKVINESVDVTFTRNVDEEDRPFIKRHLDFVLQHFDQIRDCTIKIGHTDIGGTYVNYSDNDNKLEEIYIRVYPGSVDYYLLTHELTHFLQYYECKIPQGEKSCDIWSMARHHKLNNRPPTYVSIPKKIREDWKNCNDWGLLAYHLANDAIGERENGRRQYIKWFEDKFKELSEEIYKKGDVKYWEKKQKE